jgi:hypothetical protein
VALCSGLLYAQTNVSTDISANTTWTVAGSPYTITDYINVDSAATLTIDPGVEVRFSANKSLMVHGRLIAIGTSANNVRIVGTAQPNRNNRINFDGEIQLAYVDVSNMNTGFQVSYSNPPFAPRIPNGPLCSITQSTFHHNNFALSLYPPSFATFHVDSSLFANNLYGGIKGSHCNISDCVFRLNGAGIVDMWQSTVTRCEFDRNNSGIGCTPPIQVIDCNIHDNPYGISLSLSTTGANGVVSNFTGNQLNDNAIGIVTYRDTGAYNAQLLNISSNQICSDSFNVYSQGLAAPVTTPILDLGNNCWCQWDSTGVDSTIYNTTGSPITFMPIDSTCLPSLVFPGDANHDQVANNFDLLTIGQHFNFVGYPRASISNAWTGHRARDWQMTQSNGRDLKHADCNGDSLINWNDTLAINLNYGLTHNSWRGTAAGGSTVIRFSMPTMNLNPGDTVSIPIELGTFDTLAMNIYGIAFSINYDMMIVDSASARVNYQNSWLGTKNTDILTLDKDFPTLGQLDMALVRNNHQNRTGYGTIADLIVVVNDDLSKRELPFILEFSNIRAIDSAGQVIEVRAEAGEATIETEPTLSINEGFAKDLKAYPNPVKDMLYLEHQQFTFQAVKLISVTGKQISLWEGKQKQSLNLPIPALSPGIYMLVVDMKEGRKAIKIELR